MIQVIQHTHKVEEDLYLDKKFIKEIGIILILCSFLYIGFFITEDSSSEEKLTMTEGHLETTEVITELNVEVSTEMTTEFEKDEALQEEILQLRKLYDNEDIVGYLKIDGTTIDYPVVQAKDNNFYLSHDINKKLSPNGAIFLDYENNILQDDKNTVIYGHNMRKNIMFHDLRKFLDEKFYQEHKYITFNTLYKKQNFEIFSFYKTDINFYYIQVIFKNDDEFFSLVKSMKEKSIYKTEADVKIEDRIITLSTCTNEDENTRIVLNARLIKD